MVSELGGRSTHSVFRDTRSLIVMSEQADWCAVPHAVVSKILWSDDLHFLDRLRCQEVCQAWKSLLRERPGALPYTDLFPELCIEFCRSHKGQHIALRLDEDPPVIEVMYVVPFNPWSAAPADKSTLEHTVSTCCRWMTLQARLIRKIQLAGNAPTWSLMREMVRSLQVASPQTPPAIAITTPVGNTPLTKAHVLDHSWRQLVPALYKDM